MWITQERGFSAEDYAFYHPGGSLGRKLLRVEEVMRSGDRHATIREDLYVILTALEPDGSATLKVHRNPLVNWIWIGGLTFVLGALIVLWPHPERRRP